MKTRKKRSRGGFTLVEMLCTIVVLLLLSGLLATGVRLGVFSFRKSVMASESQVLCTTLRTIVSDELRYAGTTTAENSTVKFFSQNYGEGSSFSQNDDGQVVIIDEDGAENKLLSSRAYPYGMKAKVSDFTYNESSGIFTASVTVTDSGDNELASSTFEVEKLNK